MDKLNDGKLFLIIGEVPLTIHFDNLDFIVENRDRLVNFITNEHDDSINIYVELVPYSEFKSALNDLDSPIITKTSKYVYQILWNGLEGEFSMEEMVGKLKCSHHVGVNSFLRIIFSLVLLEDQGFITHASSLIRNGKGYIFPGKSGAGKTTITRLTEDSILLSDEVSLIKKSNDQFKIFGTPFWGELAIGGMNTSINLDKVLFPIQDGNNYLKELKPLQALENLLPNVIFYYKDSELEKELFELCYEFVNSVPQYELHFKREPTFWRCIEC